MKDRAVKDRGRIVRVLDRGEEKEEKKKKKKKKKKKERERKEGNKYNVSYS